MNEKRQIRELKKRIERQRETIKAWRAEALEARELAEVQRLLLKEKNHGTDQ